MQRLPLAAPSSTLPSASTSCGTMPGSGLVAEPGFKSVAPGRGEIKMPPVSVCHQVSTIGQRAINDIAVAGDPADIGGAPINVAVVIIEHILVGIGRPQQIAARGVQH